MTFAPDWLALREPVDHASRDAGLLARAVAAVGPNAVVVDLGCGTGSSLRAFGNHPVADWQWRVVDEDEALLDIVAKRHPQSMQVRCNLKDIAALPVKDADLVTASALLDLMPRYWVEALAKRLSAERIPFYSALNYNGVMRWSPAHGDDDAIQVAFNAHQGTDKGLGPALGPEAGSATAQIFADHGYTVFTADSPWRLGPPEAELQRQLLTGIGAAAQEAGQGAAGAWAQSRATSAAQGTTYIGHTDVLALPRDGGV